MAVRFTQGGTTAATGRLRLTRIALELEYNGIKLYGRIYTIYLQIHYVYTTPEVIITYNIIAQRILWSRLKEHALLGNELDSSLTFLFIFFLFYLFIFFFHFFVTFAESNYPRVHPCQRSRMRSTFLYFGPSSYHGMRQYRFTVENCSPPPVKRNYRFSRIPAKPVDRRSISRLSISRGNFALVQLGYIPAFYTQEVEYSRDKTMNEIGFFGKNSRFQPRVQQFIRLFSIGIQEKKIQTQGGGG